MENRMKDFHGSDADIEPADNDIDNNFDLDKKEDSPTLMDNNDNDQEGFEGGSNSAGGKSSSDSAEGVHYKMVEEVTFPSLDEALNIAVDLNNITSIQQRLRNINQQPRLMSQLYPAPFHLLTKRDKRCKDCNKLIIKPNMNPTSMEKMKCDFQMIHLVPKIMIYRVGKYTPYKGPS